MRCVVSSFWLPREGSRTEHYEDAFCPRRSGARAGARLRLAVADGASESMLSGLWADLLVRTWCRSRRRPAAAVVAAAMAEWDATLGTYLEGREAEQRPIEWFEQPGLDRGAHATLLGVELAGTGGTGGWTAVSLGDSCLFQVRGDTLVRAFPVEDPAQFGNAPKLVPTRAGQLGRVLAALDRATGTWEDGDVLFLTTDALAAWFLTAAGTGAGPWRTLGRIVRDDAGAFEAWAGEQRAAGRLRNDDLTLLRVELTSARAAEAAQGAGVVRV
ncbi:MAG: protein phosphatase 2C domain-containing protein [Actinomycetota bacterium]